MGKTKKKDICFHWELNSRSFVMAEVANYLKNRSNEKKDICFRWELNSRPFIMAEVKNYLEKRSNAINILIRQLMVGCFWLLWEFLGFIFFLASFEMEKV